MATCEEIESWGTEGVCELLSRKIEDIDKDTIRAFTSNKVNGKAFVMVTENDLKEVLGERKQMQKIVESLHPKPVSNLLVRCFRIYIACSDAISVVESRI